jgi:hypothetical protein
MALQEENKAIYLATKKNLQAATSSFDLKSTVARRKATREKTE